MGGPITLGDWCSSLLGSGNRIASSSSSSKACKMPRSLSSASTEASVSLGSLQRPPTINNPTESSRPSLFGLIMGAMLDKKCCAPKGDDGKVMDDFELQFDRQLRLPTSSKGAVFDSAYKVRLPPPPPPYTQVPKCF